MDWKSGTLSVALAIFVFSSVSPAKEWRGIRPFHSTREDVERLLGEPPPPPADGSRGYALSKIRSIYFLDEGEIYIVYAEDICLDVVPRGTVLMIKATPRGGLGIASLGVNFRSFKQFDPSIPRGVGYRAYFNKKEGFLFRTYLGIVDTKVYLPLRTERLKCPDYYEDESMFVQIMLTGH